jgi:hypothetical protein
VLTLDVASDQPRVDELRALPSGRRPTDTAVTERTAEARALRDVGFGSQKSHSEALLLEIVGFSESQDRLALDHEDSRKVG